ncbi:YhgE/Pip domain-containing protein [Bacillus sp. FJAT-49736]|uniref:YhgE/Pip domain-containing protein n=1 Tax=Bacillus sp. FJAT-49736 TaxID=2833582 RepID=UPI001BC8E912|nr:YhgE/Pip domain-containing protein [Bacillus sp. FJAT-49736]MBS4171970.1 YhgE/Pip domain-containing protein [Bacillus sp. FJAT-49736]
MFIAELKKILRHPMLLISTLAITFVPIMYAGMFIWSFWDPYGHLDRLPVAVVNNDNGAVLDGEHLKLGKELADKLKDSKDFDFQIVESKKGFKELKNQDYYMLIEIPDNFSENATTLMDDQPKKLELKYIPNEGANYLSSKIGDSALKEIKASVSKEVTATYAEQIFDKLKEMGKGYAQASKGASSIYDGAKKLNNGSKTMKENLETLASKSIEFDNGLKSAADGTTDVAKGASDLSEGLGQLEEGHKQLLQGVQAASKGTNDLANGTEKVTKGLKSAEKGIQDVMTNTNKIHDGANNLADLLGPDERFQKGADATAKGASDLHLGIVELQQQIQPLIASLPDGQQKSQLQELLKQLETGSNSVAGGAESISNSIGDFRNGASDLANSIDRLNKEGNQTLKAGLDSILTGSSQVNDGANQLKLGSGQLLQGMTIFNDKLSEAGNGAAKLATGSSQLKSGMSQLTDGASKLTNGTSKLADGSKDLNSGTNKLTDGSKELKDKLGDAANKSDSIHADQKTYNMMGNPVKVDKTEMNKVPNYGTGLAPYFLSLGLFVGALLLTIVFNVKNPVITPKNGLSMFVSKFGVMALVGVIQSLIAAAIAIGGIGLVVKSIPLFIFTEMITSLTYMALILCLTALLGDPGRFLAIIILILQLTSSAGTFPLELLPPALHPVHEVLPMTFSLNAFKAVISTGNFSTVWHNLGLLAVYMVVFMAITVVYFTAKYKRSHTNTIEQAM